MLHKLASHNDDIRRLLVKGFALSIDNGHLVVRDIPYLDENQGLQIGAIVTKLVFVDETRVRLHDHQVFFCGSMPHHLDGSLIGNLNPRKANVPLSGGDIKIEWQLSLKPLPARKYTDLFHKIETYTDLISGPAIEKYSANPYTFRLVEETSKSVFKFTDTLSTRAEIGDLAQLLREDVVAVIGLGGSGSYILDFLVKSPVREVRAFDHDYYHVHNAFRSPGKLDEDELGRTKAEVYQMRYDNFHQNLSIQTKAITEDSPDDLIGTTFAFVCVDKGAARKAIVNLLGGMKIPFIDVGMGLNRDLGPISGMLRATYCPVDEIQATLERGYLPLEDHENDIYRSNIQTAELNALNASLAVVKFKQIRGYYYGDESWHNLLLTTKDLSSGSE